MLSSMFAYMHAMSVITQDHSFVHIIHDGNVYSHFLSGDIRSKGIIGPLNCMAFSEVTVNRYNHKAHINNCYYA